MNILVIIAIVLVLYLIWKWLHTNKILEMSGGMIVEDEWSVNPIGPEHRGNFQNLCFTSKPRGFYTPSCSAWQPRHLTRLPEMAQPPCWQSLTNSVANICHTVDAPKLGFESSYYQDSAEFCRKNPYNRLCPNNWLGPCSFGASP